MNWPDQQFLRAPKPDDIIKEKDPVLIILWSYMCETVYIDRCYQVLHFIFPEYEVEIGMREYEQFCMRLKIINCILLDGRHHSFVSAADGSLDRVRELFKLKN